MGDISQNTKKQNDYAVRSTERTNVDKSPEVETGNTNPRSTHEAVIKPTNRSQSQEQHCILSNGGRDQETTFMNISGSSHGSSSSSYNELSAVDEHRLRTSFKSIKDEMASQNTVSYSGNWRDGTFDDVVNRGTPDSTASSSNRFFTNSFGERRDFSIGGLQGNSPSQFNDTSLAYSTRQLIGPANAMPHNMPQNSFIEPRKSPSQRKDVTNDDNESTKRQNRCFPKFLVFATVLILALAGLAVVVVTQSDREPEADEDVTEECPDVEVNLRQDIEMRCSADYSARQDPTTLIMIPPPYVNRGQNITIVLNSKNDTEWMASLTARRRLTVSGPKATCASTGVYRLMLLDQSNTSVYAAQISVHVKSEVLQVNVTLNQTISNSSNDFTVGCSTHSGCEQSFVDFFAEINKEERHLRGVNFTCTIRYNDYDGYSVSCVGTIPAYLMSQFGRITCRPRSNLLDNFTTDAIKELEQVLELPECDISKHCGYTCDRPGDYFVVNSGRCDIFHRCYAGRVYTESCAPGTFFDPTDCTCRHTDELSWCQANGALRPNLYKDIPRKECTIKTP